MKRTNLEKVLEICIYLENKKPKNKLHAKKLLFKLMKYSHNLCVELKSLTGLEARETFKKILTKSAHLRKELRQVIGKCTPECKCTCWFFDH